MSRSDGPLLMRDDDDVVTFISSSLPINGTDVILKRGADDGCCFWRSDWSASQTKALVLNCRLASSPHLVRVYVSMHAHLTHAALTWTATSNCVFGPSLIPPSPPKKNVSKWYFDFWISYCHVNIATNLIVLLLTENVNAALAFLQQQTTCISTTAVNLALSIRKLKSRIVQICICLHFIVMLFCRC